MTVKNCSTPIQVTVAQVCSIGRIEFSNGDNEDDVSTDSIEDM